MSMNRAWIAALLVSGALSAPVQGNDLEASAGEAVASIVFDYDGSNEFLSYRVRPDGFVDAVFASNTPEPLYTEIVDKLRASPAIKGVLAGRGGPVCPRF